MTQVVSLVDSGRLSNLLRDALSWNNDISSIMVSAQNGSILAYAFRQHTPSVKAMRTRSTTVTTAYTIAGLETLVFEAQRTGALTVISSIADQILLSVTGPEPHDIDPYEKTVHEAALDDDINGCGFADLGSTPLPHVRAWGYRKPEQNDQKADFSFLLRGSRLRGNCQTVCVGGAIDW